MRGGVEFSKSESRVRARGVVARGEVARTAISYRRRRRAARPRVAPPQTRPRARRSLHHRACNKKGRNEEERGKMTDMQALKAHVKNGHFVIDEPTDLPEGTEVELQLVSAPDPWAGMAAAERAELEEEIEAGYRDVVNGDVEDGIAFAEQLLANTK